MEILYILFSFLGGALGGGIVFLVNNSSINDKRKKEDKLPVAQSDLECVKCFRNCKCKYKNKDKNTYSSQQ